MELSPGTEEVSINGNITGGTTGSVLFVGPGSTIAQDNANFFWDDTDDRLGIGIDAPVSDLHINNTSGSTLTLGREDTDLITDEVIGALNFRIQDANMSTAKTGAYVRGTVGSPITGENMFTNLVFATSNGLTATERMRIRYDGNVGIGTTNPIALFTVGGSQSGNAGFEILPGSGVVAQAVNRLTGTYQSINFDGASIGFRPNGTSKLFANTSGVGVANTNPLSILDVSGSFGAAIVTKTANYTATSDDYTILCDATSAAITITLPAAATSSRRIYVIKKIDSTGNTVTIDGNSAETIDGAATQTLDAQYEAMTVQCNGTAWFITSIN